MGDVKAGPEHRRTIWGVSFRIFTRLTYEHNYELMCSNELDAEIIRTLSDILMWTSEAAEISRATEAV